MRILSLLLALNFAVIAPARGDQSNSAPDQALWDALTNIRQRNAILGQTKFANRAQAVGILGGISSAAVYNLLRFSKEYPRVKKFGQSLTMATGLLSATSLVVGLEVLGLVSIEDLRSFKKGQRTLFRSNAGVVAEALHHVREFTRLPITDQYRMAAGDPDLRDFILRFDAWLAQDTGNNPAPPVPPDHLAR